VETAGNRNLQTRTYKQGIQLYKLLEFDKQVVGPLSTQAPLNLVSGIRRKHGFWLLENRALRKILEPEKNKVTGGWRKRHKEELCILYCSISIIRVME
jgi:hypothetical protein